MKKLFIVSIMPLILLGCGEKEKNEDLNKEVSVNLAMIPPTPQIESEFKSDELSKIKTDSFNETQKIIKEGSITFQTLDLEKTKDLIIRNSQTAKGYVSNEQQSKQDNKVEFSMDIRVPVNRFDDFLNTISKSAENIDFKNVSVKDVTEDYQDALLRIKNKKEIENRYRELLKKAQKVQEILSIEEKLGEVRTEIESFEGHIKYLDNQISYSTLHIIFYKKIGISYGFTFLFWNSLTEGWNKLTNTFLSVISFWPFLIIVVILYLVIRKYRKKPNDSKR